MHFGERETRALCRHGSARERGTKGTSLSLSLSFSLERRKRNARCLNETRAKSQSFPKFFFSLRTISRVFSLFPRRRVQKLTCVLLPSLSLFESHRARPRKDGQSLGDSTVRALVLYLLASDALVFSRARASGPTPRDFGRERERIENF